MNMKETRIKYICGSCGSDDIEFNTWSSWCIDIQEWDHEEVLDDDCWCLDCEERTSWEKVTISFKDQAKILLEEQNEKR
jgi:hypothetical protein